MVTPPIAEEEFIEIEREPWIDNLFRPLLITGMIMCLNISLVNLVRLINPAWRGNFFLLAMLVTTIEAIYSYRVLQRYRTQGVSILRYRLAEAVMLILLLKLFSFMDKSPGEIAAELQLLWSAPSLLFFNIEFYISFGLALTAWALATQTITDFDNLYDPYADNRRTIDDLASRFMWGGVLLIFVSGVTQWISQAGLNILFDFQRPTLGGVIINVLAYFMLGLVLLSQINLTRLLIRWRLQDMAVPPGLGRSWAKYGFIFLIVVTIIAFMLPTRYTLGFLATASLMVQYLINLVIFVFQFILVLISLPFVWLLSLFGSSPEQFGAGGATRPPPIVPLTDQESPPWLEILRSLLFWLLTVSLIGYMLKSYLEDHPELLTNLKKLSPFGFMAGLVGQLWDLLRGWTQAGIELIPERLKSFERQQPSLSPERVLSWLGLRNLSTRDQILNYYFNILERTTQKGPRRSEEQTPYEYEPSLQQSVPDVQGEVHELTETFVKARYSRQRFDKGQVSLAKQQWRQIKNALRRRRMDSE